MTNKTFYRLYNILFILLLVSTVIVWTIVFIGGVTSEDKLVSALSLQIDPILLLFALGQEFLFYSSIKYFLFVKPKALKKVILYGILLVALTFLLIWEISYFL